MAAKKPATATKSAKSTKAANTAIAAKSAVASKTAVASKAAPPPTVTLKHLAANLAEGHKLPKKQADTMLTDMVGMVVTHLKKGDRIRIGGLGILQVKTRAARTGRNPATGEPMQIKESRKVSFRAAKELKEAI